MAVIGTPDMAVTMIERLVEQTGGVGSMLIQSHIWADRAATCRSFELLHVMRPRTFRARFRATAAIRDGSCTERRTQRGVRRRPTQGAARTRSVGQVPSGERGRERRDGMRQVSGHEGDSRCAMR